MSVSPPIDVNVAHILEGISSDVHLASVAADAAGRSVVRLRTNGERSVLAALKIVRTRVPFATLRVVTSEADGEDEIEVRTPTPKEMDRRAMRHVSEGPMARVLWNFAMVLCILAVGIWFGANDASTSTPTQSTI